MMDWKDETDWSDLPDVYVTKAQCADGMFWKIEACSVPMALAPEVRLIRADRVVAAIAGARAQALEEAAGIVENAADNMRELRTDFQQQQISLETAERWHRAEAAAIRALSDRPDTTTPVTVDYDRSIHSNTDQWAWAEFLVKTFPNCGVDEGTLAGWFANAMMAKADSMTGTMPDTATPVIEAAKAFLESGLFYDREYLSQDLNNRLDTLRAALAAHEARHDR